MAVIRRERPQVILTYPDEQSEYPHPDHLRVHEISVVAFDAAGDPDRYPRGRRRRSIPLKLYYSVWPAERFRQIHAKFSSWDWSRRSTRRGMARLTERTTPTPRRSTCAGFEEVRSNALKAHATQVDPNSPFWFGLPPRYSRRSTRSTSFVLAKSRVGGASTPTQRVAQGGAIEDDLFAGVR